MPRCPGAPARSGLPGTGHCAHPSGAAHPPCSPRSIPRARRPRNAVSAGLSQTRVRGESSTSREGNPARIAPELRLKCSGCRGSVPEVDRPAQLWYNGPQHGCAVPARPCYHRLRTRCCVIGAGPGCRSGQPGWQHREPYAPTPSSMEMIQNGRVSFTCIAVVGDVRCRCHHPPVSIATRGQPEHGVRSGQRASQTRALAHRMVRLQPSGHPMHAPARACEPDRPAVWGRPMRLPWASDRV